MSSATKRQRLEARESAIIEAATAVYLEAGYEGARMAEIAQRAAIAEGTIYLYFKNKHALMQAVVAEHWREITRGAQAAVSEAGAFEDRVEALARYHLATMVREWKLIELNFALYFQSGMDLQTDLAAKRAYAAIFDNLMEIGFAQDRVRPGLDRGFARDLFFGALEYAARTLIIHGVRENAVDHAVAQMMAVFRQGVTQPPGASNDSAAAACGDLEARLDRAVGRLEAVLGRAEQD